MKTFPAKLLLLGEHTVNLGSQALAIPLPSFSGQWIFEKNRSPEVLTTLQMRLPQFAGYLAGLQEKGELLLSFDTATFRAALSQGLVFQSNIPTGYGVGSSGALVAAAFSEFGGQAAADGFGDGKGSLLEAGGTDLAKLKKGFAQMESFFHGTSSGTDPLICFLQKPVLLGSKDGIRPVELPPAKGDCQIFLLDTGIARQATPMIEYFLEKSREPGFRDACEKILLPAVNEAITAFLQGEPEALFDRFHRIGSFQLQHLDRMIPPAFQEIWQRGLEGDLFKFKVCGAGGGGFLLGITRDFSKTEGLTHYKLAPVLSV